MKINYRDVIIRAAKTFTQAFISAFGIDAIFGITDRAMLRKAILAMLISAVAAGISAVWNMGLEWLSNRIESIEITEAEYQPEHGRDEDGKQG